MLKDINFVEYFKALAGIPEALRPESPVLVLLGRAIRSPALRAAGFILSLKKISYLNYPCHDDDWSDVEVKMRFHNHYCTERLTRELLEDVSGNGDAQRFVDSIVCGMCRRVAGDLAERAIA